MEVPGSIDSSAAGYNVFIILLGVWILTVLSDGLFKLLNCWRIGRKLRHLPSLPSSLLGPKGPKHKRADRHRIYGELAQKYGPIMTYRILTTHVMVTDPALAAEALRHKNIDKALPHQLNLRVLDELTGRGRTRRY
ncbi:hypothetical protein WJX75_002053 [Coccomyxa subellipsoidea]|uniref:Cytochrome P450 n=1 Tax=Coccomyxa subellipsoidea TaxID=248742 RepID=A0ABR2YEQ9_9CHLO